MPPQKPSQGPLVSEIIEKELNKVRVTLKAGKVNAGRKSKSTNQQHFEDESLATFSSREFEFDGYEEVVLTSPVPGQSEENENIMKENSENTFGLVTGTMPMECENVRPVMPVLGALQKKSNRKNSKVAVSESDVVFVYFDLETGGLLLGDDILQIAMKSGEASYTSYITPTKPIDPNASICNGLTKNDNELLYRGQPVHAQPKGIVAREVLQFLKNLNKQCILIGHNAKIFDIPRLIILITQENLVAEFSKVVIGYCDTILLCKKFLKGKKRPADLKLTTLVNKFLNNPFQNAHNAFDDVAMLEQLTVTLFTNDKLFANCFTFASAISDLKKVVKFQKKK